MTVRTSRKSVTFTQPFSLSGFDEVQPAGTYTVETDEELLPGLSFPAYRRIASLIFLRSRGGGSWRLPTSICWSCKQLRKGMPACTPSPAITAAISTRTTGGELKIAPVRCAGGLDLLIRECGPAGGP